jgi:hypothetical protein
MFSLTHSALLAAAASACSRVSQVLTDTSRPSPGLLTE